MNASDPPSSPGHRNHLRTARLDELDEGDLYSALLFAASDTMDIALTREERAAAGARKSAAMLEIEKREARQPRRTPAGGIPRTPAGGIARTPPSARG